MATREDVTFASGGDPVAAWLVRAEGVSGPAPCVVMAHGFSLTRHDGLMAYAEAFAATGVHVLVFDHRFLGDSGGSPRQRFRVGSQQDDWRAAVAWAKAHPDVDAGRVALWGYSFSGGHVLQLLASGLGVRAAMVLCPFADGLRRVLATPPRVIAWILPRALLDVLGRHTTVPVTAPAGGRAAMSFDGEEEGFRASVPPGSPWRNEISPGVLLSVAFFRPVTRAAKVRVPLWVGLGVDDLTVDGLAVARVAERAPRGELHELPGDHFAPLYGDVLVQARDAQVEFLRRVLGT